MRRAEQIRGEFGTAQVVQDFLALFQAFMHVNIFGSKSTVQTSVSVVLKDCVVQCRCNTCFACGGAQGFVVMHE
jgi:hypothetical protein